MALQEALLQSLSPRPGQPEVIRLFPAWPDTWDADFRLLARGGFLITAAIRAGRVQSVEIESRLGEDCRLRNPWDGRCTLCGDDGRPHEMSGPILCFATRPEGRYRLRPQEAEGSTPTPLEPKSEAGPARFAFTLPSGHLVAGTLGRGA